MFKFPKSILRLSRYQKRAITLVLDAFFICIAFWLSYCSHLDSLDAFQEPKRWVILTLLIVTSIAVFIRLGLYRAVLRYVGMNALGAILGGVTCSYSTLLLLSVLFDLELPISVSVNYVSLSLLLVGGSRIVVRALLGKISSTNKKPVVIYGAGSAGRQLASALKQGNEYRVICFLDDDIAKHGSSIEGVIVHDANDLKGVLAYEEVQKVLLALPSASKSRRREILKLLEEESVKVQTIPGMADVVAGEMDVDNVKDVEIDDLLGRDTVAPKSALMHADIKEKVVMVTGAGGSIGSELCRQIIQNGPLKLILFELSEFALYSIEQELNQMIEDRSLPIEVYPVMGSVQNQNRLSVVMDNFKVETVYHAAAYKHVPLVEHNVVEGVKNNVFGTLYAARAAIDAGVSTFVLVSTDKAVRPTNVMGTTKRMSELILQALSETQTRTRFCMVRFGNVLGSSGSVVPLFRRQIKKGGPVTLTHQDITRYFMTIPEAAQLVIQAGAMGMGGDVFVLDMGQPIRIRDLAIKMIKLSGFTVRDDLNPEGDIEIVCTGLRPGEKLYEELLIGENVEGTTHERILSAHERKLPWSELEKILASLNDACESSDHIRIRNILVNAPTAYSPTDEICDLVWLSQHRMKE